MKRQVFGFAWALAVIAYLMAWQNQHPITMHPLVILGIVSATCLQVVFLMSPDLLPDNPHPQETPEEKRRREVEKKVRQRRRSPEWQILIAIHELIGRYDRCVKAEWEEWFNYEVEKLLNGDEDYIDIILRQIRNRNAIYVIGGTGMRVNPYTGEILDGRNRELTRVGQDIMIAIESLQS